ncbi:hypothetical protein I532_09707 [Brevibacillus borstelensis AK1]|uniref:Uncharacterized protein n=1 Tax=Brevibacillus borstelensis AK1 TaxID=1300222 RepID=M8DHP5_9BACL|nr:hypothetical protein I532_09707 [Brevibacillus borstelensis AK1]KKX55555.1 hypothetical protein X546_07725 [Brevibacillus borstelensis cifa_chp40]
MDEGKSCWMSLDWTVYIKAPLALEEARGALTILHYAILPACQTCVQKDFCLLGDHLKRSARVRKSFPWITRHAN